MLFFIFPHGTDAPVYHWPYATVATIVVNVVVFFLTWPAMVLSGDEAAYDRFEMLMLQFGYFNPLQWLTWNYMHADPLHLAGNMMVLWAFGLIVEGKIGWWRFLLLYNLVGILEGAVIQTLTLAFDEGAALGASGAIFGLIATSLVWAPMNDMQCTFVYMICLFVRWFSFECKVLTFAGIALLLELGLASLQIAYAVGTEGDITGIVTSELLHVVGAASGFAFGIAMLRRGWVDCENFDLFSVWTGRNTMTEEERKAEFLASAEGQALEASKRQQALSQFRQHLAEDQPLAALASHRRAKQRFADWRLPEQDFIVLIALLRKLRLYSQAVPVLVEYLRTYRERVVPVRLALAEILIEHMQRPGQALHVLAKLNGQPLDAAQRQLVEKLGSKAQAAYERDPYEVAPEDW